MDFSHLLTSDSVVGIDIGSSQIKIVRAEPVKGGSRITHVAICPTPQETVKEGAVTDIVEVAAAVKNCMRSAGMKSPNAIAAVAGSGVVVRQVELPTMTERALRKSIRFEASKYISATVEDSIVELDILGPAEVAGQMNVVLAAAPKVMVETRVAVLEQAGLEPLAIDVEVFTTLRSLIEYNADKSLMESNVAVLDIGASHSEINLLAKGNVELSRTIPIAGNALSNAVKSARGCSPADAESYKLELDLTELCDMPAGSTSDPSLRGVQGLIDELLREIRRSVNYYQSQLPDGVVDNAVDILLLTGGTSRFKGLAPYINSRLGMDVRIGNPSLSRYISGSAESALNVEDIPLISVAFGLAVKETRALPVRQPVAA